MSVRLSYRIRRRAEKSADWLGGWIYAYGILKVIKLLKIPVKDISIFQRRIPFIEKAEYSQNGEDGILHALFAIIGTTNKYYVEFGAEDGVQCNSRYLRKHKGWSGLLLDGGNEDASINLHREFITAENIEELFTKYNIPKEFDLLSIDIDGNDYWVWQAIKKYSPRAVIIEYNACFPFEESKTIPYEPSFQWDKTDYMGATLKALIKLGKEKGYTLVATDKCGVNAFFVRDNLLSTHFDLPSPEKLFHPAAFKGKPGNKHPPDTKQRPWITI